MTDKTFTQADIDAAVAKAVGDLEGLKANLTTALDEAKEAKRKLRAASEIKPEDLTAAEERAEKAEAEAKRLTGELTKAQKAAEAATKALETEQASARTFAQEATLADAIAKANVVPALVPAFKAMIAAQAKTELVDGKFATMIGDKPASDYITEFMNTDDGKAFRAAPVNGGGGANGGGGKGEGGKTVTRTEWDGMDHVTRASFSKDGGKVVDQAA